MTIDISKIDKEVFKRILEEENERDEMTRGIYKRQIEQGQTYEKPKEFQDVYDLLVNKKRYFDFVIALIPKTTKINISKEELEYFKLLTNNQKYISNYRIKDWSKPNGELYYTFHNQCVNVQGQSEEEFEKAREEMIDYDKKNIECCDMLINLLSIKVD